MPLQALETEFEEYSELLAGNILCLHQATRPMVSLTSPCKALPVRFLTLIRMYGTGHPRRSTFVIAQSQSHQGLCSLRHGTTIAITHYGCHDCTHTCTAPAHIPAPPMHCTCMHTFGVHASSHNDTKAHTQPQRHNSTHPSHVLLPFTHVTLHRGAI